MKNARRQGRRDARGGKPRFVPAFWLDRQHYNEGYDEELAKQGEETVPELHCCCCGLSKASIAQLQTIASGNFSAELAASFATQILDELGVPKTS